MLNLAREGWGGHRVLVTDRLLCWEPKIPFAEGLGRTADWYYSTKQQELVMAMLDRRLTER